MRAVQDIATQEGRLNHSDNRPASRAVIVLLALVVIGLVAFYAPGNAEGNQPGIDRETSVIDASAIPYKCLTQNQKGVNCVRLETVQPAESVRTFYSRCIGSKTDIGTTQEFAQTEQIAGLHSDLSGSVAR